MCLPMNTEKLSARGAAEQKAVTYRENIQGVRIQLVGGSRHNHWEVSNPSDGTFVPAIRCSAPIGR